MEQNSKDVRTPDQQTGRAGPAEKIWESPIILVGMDGSDRLVMREVTSVLAHLRLANTLIDADAIQLLDYETEYSSIVKSVKTQEDPIFKANFVADMVKALKSQVEIRRRYIIMSSQPPTGVALLQAFRRARVIIVSTRDTNTEQYVQADGLYTIERRRDRMIRDKFLPREIVGINSGKVWIGEKDRREAAADVEQQQ